MKFKFALEHTINQVDALEKKLREKATGLQILGNSQDRLKRADIIKDLKTNLEALRNFGTESLRSLEDLESTTTETAAFKRMKQELILCENRFSQEKNRNGNKLHRGDTVKEFFCGHNIIANTGSVRDKYGIYEFVDELQKNDSRTASSYAPLTNVFHKYHVDESEKQSSSTNQKDISLDLLG
ncbi:hypothetical protein [Piscirickettsia litoralis]|uniref:Uncharacterized protein n=1 Tax=Piscirickettsia litoralis TaxID=1891921 RepID=A0ABX3A3C3_9GAMM|nr:hypothetical protein [Piscirickettsia litoralis]ODN43377.1 hypothetical protein BGC07_11135 [Piscirickettsia litoralis]